MNVKEIKKIILEEIEDALKERGTPLDEFNIFDTPFVTTPVLGRNVDPDRPKSSPEELAADSRPEEDEIGEETFMASEPPLDEADTKDIDAKIQKDPAFLKKVQDATAKAEKGDSTDLALLMLPEGLDEMARTSNIFKLSQEASLKDVLQFMQRVNDVLKTYKSPGQKRPKKRFTPEEIKALATAMLKPEGFTSKDIIAATSYSSPAQANKFLAALEQKGLITITSVLKKSLTPDRDPNAPETRGRKRTPDEFDVADDPTGMDFSDFADLDLSDPLAENNNLTNYIKKTINEAKNPLAQKMKEIENQGRKAALETKLAAIQEMIDETNDRLTRIDEDNEFNEMMDKKKVKEVRKQLKELEKAQTKLQKEYGKMKNSMPKNYDEDGKKVMDEEVPVEEDAIDNTVDEVELEEDDLRFEGLNGVHDLKPMVTMNESIERMQKLANLRD